MNEIKRIHLGRQPFVIAVDAYKALKEYLDAIKLAVGTSHHEVIEEVELRMAELLAEKGVHGEKAIVRADIEYLQAQLGNPGDFAEDGDEAVAELRNQANESKAKRLFRDPENGMVAGVSSGLAAYFGIDAVIVRLVFVLTVLLGGWGIAIYLLLWILVPEAKTTSEKLQMRGKAITVDTLKQVVDQADVPGAAQRASRTVAPFMQKTGLVIVILIGLGFLFFGICTLLGVSVGGAYGLLYQDNIFMYGDFGLSPRDYLFGGSVFTAIAAIGIALTLVGVAMMRRKWFFPGWATAGLLSIFFVTTIVAAALAPGIIDKARRYDNAIKHQDTTSVAPFTAVRIVSDEGHGMPVKYDYEQSATHRVDFAYIGDADASAIKTSVKDGVLTVDTRAFNNEINCKGLCIVAGHNMTLTIKSPQLTKLMLEGHGGVEIYHGLNQEMLDIEVAAGGYVNLGKVSVDKVMFVSNDGAGLTRAVLSGVRADAVVYDAVSVGDGHIIVPRANEVILETNRECDYNDAVDHAFVRLERMPARGITANGVGVTDVQQLDQRQREDRAANPFRCINVGY